MTMAKIIKFVESFPKADSRQVEIAAEHLKMMHYDFRMGPYQIDLLNPNMKQDQRMNI